VLTNDALNEPFYHVNRDTTVYLRVCRTLVCKEINEQFPARMNYKECDGIHSLALDFGAKNLYETLCIFFFEVSEKNGNKIQI
jgi:hypothetical protein